MDLDKLRLLFPIIYLILAAVIAIVCYLLEIPEGVIGLLVGAALTKVKTPLNGINKP